MLEAFTHFLPGHGLLGTPEPSLPHGLASMDALWPLAGRDWVPAKQAEPRLLSGQKTVLRLRAGRIFGPKTVSLRHLEDVLGQQWGWTGTQKWHWPSAHDIPVCWAGGFLSSSPKLDLCEWKTGGLIESESDCSFAAPTQPPGAPCPVPVWFAFGFGHGGGLVGANLKITKDWKDRQKVGISLKGEQAAPGQGRLADLTYKHVVFARFDQRTSAKRQCKDVGQSCSTMKYVILGISESYQYGYGSIPINTIFSGMNIHKSQLFWCELQGYYWFWHSAIWSPKWVEDARLVDDLLSTPHVFFWYTV